MGFNAFANPAMKYAASLGNHGGEVILTAKHTYSVPIDPIILEASESANLEIPRFTASEVRYGQTSILTIVAYFWCSEGLSPRNFAILQQISSLIKQFKIPFLLFADFNMEPEHIMASGWPNEHAASLLVPTVNSTCKGSNKVIDYCIVSASFFLFAA